MNSNRTSNKQRKIKATDVFDRKKQEEERLKKRTTPQDIEEQQREMQKRAARLPVPKKLREHRP